MSAGRELVKIPWLFVYYADTHVVNKKVGKITYDSFASKVIYVYG